MIDWKQPSLLSITSWYAKVLHGQIFNNVVTLVVSRYFCCNFRIFWKIRRLAKCRLTNNVNIYNNKVTHSSQKWRQRRGRMSNSGFNFTKILHAAFTTKVLRKAFLCLHFRFELFLAQEYWHKCAHKMLVKLTTGVNFTNIFEHFFRTKVKRAAFLCYSRRLIFLGARRSAQKLLIKCW